ncbi:MAG TPA: AAA family ATPase [Blastocatellia bacterium]|nr:AAA family ATPase [Blastocatellia bacterium]HMV82700.1 AAA family ATPase [Blastocatellia bacterium]HMX26120.1 AAA family ATPase [Blastocatellia bacterium]HMY72711.1 AAA family ATPase [Blastocatellia bacterium]HMZ16783.1 AAA family ATPase [Blastocatellia bacterium]
MPELESISIKGFKSIASVEKLPLNSINVVIGANGSGKSNFIGVFSFLHAIRAGHLQEYVAKAGGAGKVLHFGSKVTPKLSFHVIFKDKINQYELELHPTDSDNLIPTSERVYFWNKSHPQPHAINLDQVGKEAGIGYEIHGGVASRVRDHFDRWRLYHFHDTSSNSPLKSTANIHDNRYLRPDGSNLAAFLYYLRKRHESSYALIRSTIRQIASFFDDFLLEPQQLNPDMIRLGWRHQNSDAYFDVASLSDGTLRFIALATLFLQPEKDRPSVILVDEPELGLHPYAITMLAELVKQAAVTTQVIVSTQSPQLLDHFEPEDVIVTDLVNGATQFRRLSSADLYEWLEAYSLGQLWEKNELGGCPGGL